MQQQYDPASGTVVSVVTGLQDAAGVTIVRSAPHVAADRLSFGEIILGAVLHPDAKAGVAADALSLVDAAQRSSLPTADSALAIVDLAAASVGKVFQDCAGLGRLGVVQPSQRAFGDDGAGPEPRGRVRSGPLGNAVAVRSLCGGRGRRQSDPARSPGRSGRRHWLLPLRLSGGLACGLAAVAAAGIRQQGSFAVQPDQPRDPRRDTLIVFADPMWPKVQTQALTFSGMTQAEAQALQDFIAAHLGLEVGFVDWEQRYWKGVIVNTTNPVVQDGKEMYTASLEFECELTTWTP